MTGTDKRTYLSMAIADFCLIAFACVIGMDYLMAVLSLLMAALLLYWLGITIRRQHAPSNRKQDKKDLPFTD